MNTIQLIVQVASITSIAILIYWALKHYNKNQDLTSQLVKVQIALEFLKTHSENYHFFIKNVQERRTVFFEFVDKESVQSVELCTIPTKGMYDAIKLQDDIIKITFDIEVKYVKVASINGIFGAIDVTDIYKEEQENER